MKKPLILCLALALAFLLTACGNAPEARTLPDCAALGESILASQAFSAEMFTVGESKLMRSLGLAEADYTQGFMSVDASRATPECVIVIIAKDEARLTAVKERLEAYRTDTLEDYRDYRPKEAHKLESAVVIQNGLQCVLAVCGDQAAAQKACEALWK